MSNLTFFTDIPPAWHYVVAFLTVFISAIASGHAILLKRDSRAAVLWVGFIWLVPLVGAILYVLLGINRLRRQAFFLRSGLQRYAAAPSAPPCSPETVEAALGSGAEHLAAIATLSNRIMRHPLVPGNRVEPLINGDETYVAMLEAIGQARETVTLASYIFDNDPIGRRFADALAEAVDRGVQVRVLIDATGARYSFPSIVGRLRRRGIPVARFLRTYIWRPKSINLRNHRKLLVADGRVGFTGGINIRQGNLIASNPRRPVQDLHFRVTGPAVAHLQAAFADDWFFCTRESLRGELWFPPLDCEGTIIARGISDGPDEDFEKLRWALLGAISCARSRIQIVTPYFLPDQAIISALNVAAMRGVQVDLILPAKNNLPYVQWATFAILWQILERGCRVWLSPPPFDHSKLMLVDGHWALIGSGNWDARSLRLNFEFNVECYGRDFVARLEQLIHQKLTHARPLSLEDVDGRSLPIKLRDGIMRLMTPFL